MGQPLFTNRKSGKIAVFSGFITVLFFILCLLFLDQQTVFYSTPLPLHTDFANGGPISALFYHLFILMLVVFSGLVCRFARVNHWVEFREATLFTFIGYAFLFLRTFLLIFDTQSFYYILTAGVQVLVALVGMLFYLITFISNPKAHPMAFLLGMDMMLYLLSVLFSVFSTEFILPNFGTLLAAVANVSIISLFFYWALKKDALTQELENTPS
ncbi:hypothetical protein [Enterococcus asini]|uniref:hypothetical protein n=1 Tax=Enterococcus asini TaxID=57732 RepID=UPI000E50112A|nr:hypothetical protein [Enterococcus asini]RGW13217.1 hypothetical protein DWV91_05835 [Enterococcus asini]